MPKVSLLMRLKSGAKLSGSLHPAYLDGTPLAHPSSVTSAAPCHERSAPELRHQDGTLANRLNHSLPREIPSAQRPVSR